MFSIFSTLKSLLKAILPQKAQRVLSNFYHLHISRYAQKTHALQGEDMILKEMFGNQPRGFYVDVGAHHPFRFSNTYIFYKRGWRGLNIDALPGSMKLFNRYRSRDINIECGVAFSGGGGSMIYYRFNEPALNTFSPTLKDKYNSHPSYHLLDEIEVPVRSLKSILDENLPPNTQIDFMSIDVEGLDLEVLQSNNWQKYRPKVLLAEASHTNIDEILKCDIALFLDTKGYKLFAKTTNTLIFKAS